MNHRKKEVTDYMLSFSFKRGITNKVTISIKCWEFFTDEHCVSIGNRVVMVQDNSSIDSIKSYLAETYQTTESNQEYFIPHSFDSFDSAMVSLIALKEEVKNDLIN